MKIFTLRNLLLILIGVFVQHTASAQCAACKADPLCPQQVPGGGLCDTNLPPYTAGVYKYDSIRYYLPFFIPDAAALSGGQATSAQLDKVILSKNKVSGLPFGLDIEFTNGGVYFPGNGDTIGCGAICGTALIPGVYEIRITVTADVTAYGTPVGTVSISGQEFDYISNITVLPGGGGTQFGNVSLSTAAVCDSGDVTANTQIDFAPLPTDHEWIFPDGTTSNLMDPGPKVYDQPGKHMVILKTLKHNFVVEKVTLDAVGSGWCGDTPPTDEWDDLGTCVTGLVPISPLGGPGFPDVYYEMYIGGSRVSTSSTKNNLDAGDFPATWTENKEIPEIDATSPVVVQIFDADDLSADDNIGLITVVPALGDVNFSTSSGNTGKLTFGKKLVETIIDTAYIIVGEAISSVPPIQSTPDTFCAGGGTEVFANFNFFSDTNLVFQWYRDSNSIPGATGPLVIDSAGGTYYYEVFNTFSKCRSSSPEHKVYNGGKPQLPVIGRLNTGGLGTLYTSNDLNVIGYQWYRNGNPIANTNQRTLDLSALGDYTLEFTNKFGCKNTSDTYTVLSTGLEEATADFILSRVYPNPTNGDLRIEVDFIASGKLNIQLMDQLGRVVRSKELKGLNGFIREDLDLSELAKGVYHLVLSSDNQQLTEKIHLH